MSRPVHFSPVAVAGERPGICLHPSRRHEFILALVDCRSLVASGVSTFSMATMTILRPDSLPPPPPRLLSSALQAKIAVGAQPLLNLLLGAELVGVTALLLAAVGGSGGQAGVALSADHLLAVVFRGEGLEGGFDDTTAETEDEMQRGFLCRAKSENQSQIPSRANQGSGERICTFWML